MRGDRRSTKRGSSVEFADYRNYAPGDDLRRVDWNLYARTDRLFLKIYEEEEDLQVHLLVDTSASMGFGSPSKLAVARRLAAALGYVALNELDRLLLGSVGVGGVATSRPLRGSVSNPAMLGFLEGLKAEGQVSLSRSLDEYARARRTAGLVFVITDLFDPAGVESGLRSLAARGHEIVLLHLLSPEELEPPISGDLELVDSESGERSSLTVDQAAVEAYRRRLSAWLSDVRQICNRLGASYALVNSGRPVEELLFGDLRNGKVLV